MSKDSSTTDEAIVTWLYTVLPRRKNLLRRTIVLGRKLNLIISVGTKLVFNDVMIQCCLDYIVIK